jgi:hypothetical protein
MITLDTGPKVDTAEGIPSPSEVAPDWPKVVALPFEDATFEAAAPVDSSVETTAGSVKTDVSTPTEGNEELDSEDEIQMEESGMVVLMGKAASGGVLGGDGGILVIFVEPAISVIAVSFHADAAPSEVTGAEVIALFQSLVGDSAGEVSAPGFVGELEGWTSEGIGSVATELHIDDGPADDGTMSGVEVEPTSDAGGVEDPSETMLDDPTLADGSDHTDEGLPAAALVDSP